MTIYILMFDSVLSFTPGSFFFLHMIICLGNRNDMRKYFSIWIMRPAASWNHKKTKSWHCPFNTWWTNGTKNDGHDTVPLIHDDWRTKGTKHCTINYLIKKSIAYKKFFLENSFKFMNINKNKEIKLLNTILIEI